MERLKKDRDWAEYPLGTKAHAYNGGHWLRVERGWKWCGGDTFPTPGGDAMGYCVELPSTLRATHNGEYVMKRTLVGDIKVLAEEMGACPTLQVADALFLVGWIEKASDVMNRLRVFKDEDGEIAAEGEKLIAEIESRQSST